MKKQANIACFDYIQVVYFVKEKERTMLNNDYIDGADNNRRREQDFLKSILKLLNEDKADNNYRVSVGGLTKEIQLALKDIFNADIIISSDNELSLVFYNGERFGIRIEKC